MESQHEARVSARSESVASDEAARRVASSPGPRSDGPSEHDEEVRASVPAGDPEAPVGPAPPAAGAPPATAQGQQRVAEEDERGADRDRAAEREPEVDDEAGLASEHDQVRRDLEELTARAAKADEYLELAQRTQADFENYRKRAVREARLAQDRGVAKLARELLPAVDNLDRALAAAETTASGEAGGGAAHNGSEANLLSGIRLVHADVIAALARVGIEPYSPQGETFDPQHHEAVAQKPVQGAEPGTVVEVYQCGYRHGDAVLRPARVVVAG